MSLSPFIFFASACEVVASVSTVALPPVLVLYFTTTGSPPNRLATICAALVASRRKTPSSPNRPNDTTVILRGLSAACTAATIDTHVRRKTVTGALSRLTSNSIVTTNLHSNTFRACRRARARPLGQHTGGSHRPTRSLSASSSRAGFAYLHLVILSADKESSCKIGVVDQLETAIAAALTGSGVGSVFRIRDKRLGRFRRWKLQKCNKRGIQRLAFQRLDVPAASQVLAAMFVHNIVHRSRVRRHPSIVSHHDVCDHVNSHCLYLL